LNDKITKLVCFVKERGEDCGIEEGDKETRGQGDREKRAGIGGSKW
jgi:hypothetical protein